MGNMIDSMRGTAQGIARDFDAQDTAARELRFANAKLLEAVVDAIRPALAAMSSSVPLEQVISPAGKSSTPAPWRGLLLATENVSAAGGPIRARETAAPDRGYYCGRDLFITAGGTFMQLRYTGRWFGGADDVVGNSAWVGEVFDMTTEDVAAYYGAGMPTILERIGKVLSEQAGAREKRGSSARLMTDRADRIMALAMLMRSI